MGLNVKIKIALSKDEVRILIKILVGDQWAFVFRGGKIDNRTRYDINHHFPVGRFKKRKEILSYPVQGSTLVESRRLTCKILFHRDTLLNSSTDFLSSKLKVL